MNYPLISEYIEAIKSAEDNFEQLKHLRPVLDDDGQPIMSSGNFAVVFKMKDERTGKMYAVKCFLKEQEGRAKAYSMIAEELERIRIASIKSTNNDIENIWTFFDFCRTHGIMKRGTFSSEDRNYVQRLIFPKAKDGLLLLDFSSKLGELSNEELRAKRHSLQVVQFENGRYELYPIGEPCKINECPYFTQIKYLDRELFVDTNTSDETEFPILLMDWVEGVTLDKYIREHIDDQYELSLLAYQFSRLAMWLIPQPFAHGDLKPDNILVREDGTLTLVDYDGMYVPAMKGQKARELGSPDFRHPSRTEDDFNEHIDDFSVASILLSLKAIALKPSLLEKYGASDRLLFSGNNYSDISHCEVMDELFLFEDSELKGLFCSFLFCINNKHFSNTTIHFLGIRETESKDNYGNFDHFASIPEDIFRKNPHLRMYNNGLYTSDYKNLVYYPHIKESHEILLHPNTEVLSFGFEDVGEAADPESSYQWQWNDYPTTILYQCTPNIKFELPVNALLCVPKGTVDLFVNLGYEKTKIVEGLVYIDPFGVVYSHDKKELLKFPFYSDLEYYRIIDTCETIGDDAFRRYATCVGYEGEYYEGNCLKCIVLPDSLKTIGKLAFYKCEFLESISIPSNVEYIEEDAFLGCTGLNSIIVDKRNCKYDSRNNCNAIIESTSNTLVIGCKKTRIPDTITTIGKGAFYDCWQLKRIIIPESIIAIKEDAFCGCFNLSSVIIPDSTVFIGDGAFYKCTSIESIYIGKNISQIGSYAFDGCSELTSLSVNEKNKTFDSRENCNAIIETATNSLLLGCASTIIPNSVRIIGRSAFESSYKLESINLPDSITNIEDSAFHYCSQLRSIAIPVGVREIGNYVFDGCSTLESISFPNSILKIGDGILNNCYNLKIIHIPAGKIWNYKKLLPDYDHHLFVEDYYEELPF